MSDVALAWTVPPAATDWTEIHAYEKVGTAFNKLGSTTNLAGPYTITNVASGSHTYMIRSWNASNESPNSNEVTGSITAIPLAPLNLTITVVVK